MILAALSLVRPARRDRVRTRWRGSPRALTRGDGQPGAMARLPVPRGPTRCGWTTETWYHRMGCRQVHHRRAPHRHQRVRPVSGRRAGAASGERVRMSERGQAMRLPPQPGEVIDRGRAAGVHAGTGARFHGLRGGHDRLRAGRRRRAGVLAELEVPPPARPAHRHLPRPRLHGPGRRRAERPRRPPAGRPAAWRCTAQNAWPSLRFDAKAVNRLAGRFLDRRLLLQDLHASRASVACLRERAAAVRQRRDACRRTPPQDPRRTSATPIPMSSSPAAARRAWRRRSAPPGRALGACWSRRSTQLGGHLRWGGDGRPGRAGGAGRPVAAEPGIEVLTDAVVLGRYDGNWIAVVRAAPRRRGRRAARSRRAPRRSWSRRA